MKPTLALMFLSLFAGCSGSKAARSEPTPAPPSISSSGVYESQHEMQDGGRMTGSEHEDEHSGGSH